MRNKSLPDVREETVQIVIDAKLIVILRQIPLDAAEQVAAALREAGVRIIEVAMNSERPLEQLRLLRRHGFCVGAGTILDKEQAEAAIRAGARFLFTPIRPAFFMSVCRSWRVLGIAGGLTPTEIYALHREGNQLIKLFPSVPFGPEYVRQIMAPCPSLKLIPTGGVTLSLAENFLSAGAVAIAVGQEIVDQRLLEAGRANKIADRARSFVAMIEKQKRTSPSSPR